MGDVDEGDLLKVLDNSHADAKVGGAAGVKKQPPCRRKRLGGELYDYIIIPIIYMIYI